VNATDHIRWNEPGLRPRGLLRDAPSPRPLFEAQTDRMERQYAQHQRNTETGPTRV
jgi:hypothetical protein